MRAIWKFPFEVQDTFELRCPAGAVVLSVQVQNYQPCIWMLVDLELSANRIVSRVFHLRGTGRQIPDAVAACPFVGTFQLADGRFVHHLFDGGEA